MGESKLYNKLKAATASDVRQEIRAGRWIGPTRGLAGGFVQAAVIGLPAAYASDFLVFCTKNKAACPLIEITDTGISTYAAPGSTVYQDVPSYNLYRHKHPFPQP
jgi:uncharacterized protein YcsI (UPF0317 family)